MDSVFDRWGEAVVYTGLIAGLVAAGHTAASIYAAAAMGAAFMVSYARSKAEGLGFSAGTGMAAVGIMPREVRLVVITIGLVIGGLIGSTVTVPDVGILSGGGTLPLGILILQVALAIIAVGATITVVQRILHVRRQARAQATRTPSPDAEEHRDRS